VPAVLVLGAGATGSVFGARLAAAGVSVTLVARAAHVEAIRAHGLVVDGLGSGPFRPAAVTQVPRGGPLDAVLVTVKSYDLEGAALGLAQARPPVATALLGNGLGIEAIAARGLAAGGWSEPERWCVRGIHTVPATLVGPGRVRATGVGEVVLPDPATAGPASAQVPPLVSLLTGAGFSVRTSRTFDLELWRKAVVNAAINPVTAVHGVPNGALASGPLAAEAGELVDEAVAVARAEGVGLTGEVAREDLARVLRGTADNRSSMLQDVDRGRPTELGVISEEIVRRGHAHGLALPATERAVAAVRRAVERARARAQP
jgi:2-dehydropantoate 2-reductase